MKKQLARDALREKYENKTENSSDMIARWKNQAGFISSHSSQHALGNHGTLISLSLSPSSKSKDTLAGWLTLPQSSYAQASVQGKAWR